MRLAEMTWPQAEAYFKEHDTVLIALGSTECHGRHMPLGTDWLIPEKILEVLEPLTDALIAPTMPYGNTDYLSVFPGTVSLGPEVTYQVMSRILDGLRKHGARRFVVLNGHGGNNAPLDRLALDLQEHGCVLIPVNWWTLVWDLVPDWNGNTPWSGGHGGAEETAAVMAINPDLIDYDAIADSNLKGLSDELPFSSLATVRFRGVDIPVRRFSRDVTDNGWAGSDHPKYATKEWGEQMIRATAAYTAALIEALTKVDLDR
ncbi:MAG: creatininase family protein [Solobacterium sp.]|nr:creatininase family protein [Solobacterium sp.]